MEKSLTDKTYRAGGYLRLSIEDENKDNESVSIKNQRIIIDEFALNNNIEIYDYYVDDGYSGGNFDRPAFKRLINDIEMGIINCVITKDMSRLGREFIETGNYIYKYFPEHNVRYIAILENYDALRPNGSEDMIPFKAVINDMYLIDISRKVKSVRHDMMKKGEFVSGSVPYGYKRSLENSKKLVIDEYAASIVKRIFNLKDNGNTCGMIAKVLTNEGILPPDVYKGKKLKQITISTNLWDEKAVKHIIKNEAYTGTLIQGKYERVSLKSKKKRLLPKSKWVVCKGALPQIISEDIFKRVNSTFNNNGSIRNRQYDYLLKGLVVCGECGKTMLVRRVKNQSDPTIITPIYVCRTYARYRNNVCSMHYYREDALNEIVLREVRNILVKYANNTSLENNYKFSISNSDILKDYEASLKKYKTKIVTIDKAISDLYKDRACNIISTNEFSNIKSELEKERQTCVKEINNLEIGVNKSKSMVNDEKATMKIINDFLKMKNPTKEILKELISKIEIHEDKTVKIFFNFRLNEEVYE